MKPIETDFSGKRFTKLALALWLLTSAGCSSTTFLYNRLDFIVPWYMGSYVDLNRGQKDYLDELLQPFLEWHRREELPVYLEIIEDMEIAIDSDLSAEDVSSFALRFEAAWFRLEEKGLEWLFDLGERLSDEQVDRFIQELWKRQEEYEEKYLDRSDADFHRESYENLRDSLQDYMGRLNEEQRQLLQAAGGELVRSDNAWLAERATWLERLEVFLQRDPGWQEAIREALDKRNETVSEDYQQTYQHNLQVIAEAVADTINGRTEKQDKRLRRKLSGFREDLETLIQQ